MTVSPSAIAAEPRPLNPPQIDGYRGLALWSGFNLVIPILTAMLPGRSEVASSVPKVVVVSVLLNLILTYWKVRLPLRIPAAIAGMVLLNGWIVVCSYNAALTLSRSSVFGIPDYFMFMYFLLFMQAAALNYYRPQWREIYIKCIIAAACIHSVVAILQFVHFGPALKIAENYNGADITDWSGKGDGGTRVVGLTGWPLQMTEWAMFGFSFFAGVVLSRKFKPWEALAAFGFLGVAFMAQLRGVYPVLGLLFVWFIFALVRRHREGSIGYLAFFVTCLVGVGFAAYERLKYGLNANTDTLAYRLKVGWPQAYRVLEVRPLFGIGPETGFISSASTTVDRFVKGFPLDNGYLDFAAWGGFPAVILVALTGLVAVKSVFTLLLQVDDPFRKRVVFMLLVQVLIIFVGMNSNPLFFDYFTVQATFGIAGVAMATESEYRRERGRLAY